MLLEPPGRRLRQIVKLLRSRLILPRSVGKSFWNRAQHAQEGLAMTKLSGKRNLIAILSIVTLGAAFSFGINPARAGDDVSEDQIVRALTPKPKPPLTRGLSVGPQTAEPAANPAEAKIIASVRGRTTRSLSNAEREEIATIAKDKPNIDLDHHLRLQLGRHQCQVASRSAEAGPRAHQRQPERLDLPARRPHRRRRWRRLQPGTVRTPRRTRSSAT